MRILYVLLAVLAGFVIAEFYLLVKIGTLVGAANTIVLSILTAIVGVWLLRLQGFSTLLRAETHLQRGELPALELIEGLLLFLSGALLLVPGFLSDGIGFLLLIAPLRRWILRRLLRSAPSADHRTIRADYRIEDD